MWDWKCSSEHGICECKYGNVRVFGRCESKCASGPIVMCTGLPHPRKVLDYFLLSWKVLEFCFKSWTVLESFTRALPGQNSETTYPVTCKRRKKGLPSKSPEK